MIIQAFNKIFSFTRSYPILSVTCVWIFKSSLCNPYTSQEPGSYYFSKMLLLLSFVGWKHWTTLTLFGNHWKKV